MRIEKAVFGSTWMGAALGAAMVLVTLSADARPKGDKDPDDPRDPGGDTGPGDHPWSPPPVQKPQIPGYVLSNNAYYRETTLPLCEWGQGPRSFSQFFYPTQEQQDAQEPANWTCYVGSNPDSCAFTAEPPYRPTNAGYTLATRDHYEADLQWPDGSAAYGSWGISCTSAAATDVTDTVQRSIFEGVSWNGSTCQSLTTPSRRTLIAELNGGDVEHIRPAIVRAQANAGYYSYSGQNVRELNFVIQVYGETGWEDFKKVTFATAPQPALHEIEAVVPPGSSVRFQIRGTQQCQYHYGDGYDIRSMRILVETCIPDQNNPGTCL